MSLRTTIRRLFQKAAVARLYDRKSYLDAYAAHTDMRVRENPYTAIGEGWEEIGRLQYDYLVANGLEPHHTMLDIGCGTLRGGRHFIRYLEPDRYTGMDISPEAIAFGARLVEKEGLSDRRPTLLVSPHRDLRFREFAGKQFDFLLAQSVFSHLPAENIEECFAHAGQIMKPSSRFFFTFHENATPERRGMKAFFYPLSFFETLASRHGFSLDPRRDYNHPSQSMVRLTRSQADELGVHLIGVDRIRGEWLAVEIVDNRRRRPLPAAGSKLPTHFSRAIAGAIAILGR